MNYEKLKTINPSIEDVTIKSSIWLASRLMPAKGHELISFPHFRTINKTAMRICNFSDLNINGLLGMNDSEAIINLESSASNLVWNGCWAISNQTIIGRGHSSFGLVCPFNTFNVGIKYKNGWRPSRVN